ncbi:MAG: indolepyruvate ferredoxin oxidoreductase subunit alpha [Chloroflexota bacterium]
MSKVTIASDAPGQKVFMLGNEAIARGAVEGGVQLAAAYPGTPSSEILATLAGVAKDLDIYTEWSTNEKVAFEVAMAASYSGLRSMASMKHVGVNVAHEPLMQASHLGAVGGMVLVEAEDPSAWSSQNEQDNRWIAEQAFLPVLEPSSVQEAKDMMSDIFELSEKFGHPFIFRSVTRIGHARGDVTLGEVVKEKRKGVFKKDPNRLVYVPAVCRKNKPLMLNRMEEIKKAADTMPYNQLRLVEGASKGIIACGISYSYTVEALKWLGLEDSVSVLKIGTPHPLPEELVKTFSRSVSEALVIEELDPFVELHVRALAQEAGISVGIHGKDLVSNIGEFSTRSVVEALVGFTGAKAPVDFGASDRMQEEMTPLLPTRPPAMCPGCPHRASYYVMKRAARRVAKEYGEGTEPIFPGDIGCYTVGFIPPLEIPDTTFCMGASFGFANGLAHAVNAPIVPLLGDSTFFHSGIPPLVNAVYNQANITMVVLDNGATAMTGFQPHPGTGRTAMGDEAPVIRPEEVARACGVKFVEVADQFETKKAMEVMEKALRFEGPAVVVFRSPCALIEQRERTRRGEQVPAYFVDEDKCNPKCNSCIDLLGCPAIVKMDGKVAIDESLCTGCGLCAQVCPYGAILQRGKV